MTNRQRRRAAKDKAVQERDIDTVFMQEIQGKTKERRTPANTGCQKRRTRKNRCEDPVLRFTQSRYGYLRPYYPMEYAAIRRVWRDGRA